ncbi:MAG: glycosyltransferase family 1 protein [Anaerolineae bacterium]|nr:glycosyltransferase family 4 protein [Anaerolineales bacterium]MCQ3975949.1 glycosyltransferase family 1 protein [Anaerolineae bacterium]
MKIAINAWFWDNPSVGSGQYLRYLLPALLEADPSLDITLIAPKPFDPDPATLHPRLKFLVTASPFGSPSSNLAKVWFEQITFPRACRKLKVNLAHVPYFGSPLAPPVPTVVTIHDVIPMVLPEYRGGFLVRLYTSLVAAAAGQAQLILADSEASRQDILAKLRLPAERVRTVYLAPAPHFQPAETWQQLVEIKQKYKLPENFVLYLGGYDVRKNVSALLHAYTWVSATLGDQYPLVLAGRLPETDTAFFPDPRRIARELGLEEAIIAPGWIAEEDKPLLYAAATVFVYPSRYEGFGLPVLEAMACGVPVVTTNAASIPELAGPAAFQLDPSDTKHMAAPIIRLCTEEESRDAMIERGFAQVEKFSWAQTAQETLQAYREAAFR